MFSRSFQTTTYLGFICWAGVIVPDDGTRGQLLLLEGGAIVIGPEGQQKGVYMINKRL